LLSTGAESSAVVEFIKKIVFQVRRSQQFDDSHDHINGAESCDAPTRQEGSTGPVANDLSVLSERLRRECRLTAERPP
jgi:hypothetical protein